MRILLVYAHPNPASYTANIRAQVEEYAGIIGAELRVHDLYAEGFEPVMRPDEFAGYNDTPRNRAGVKRQCADIEWCDTLIFVYPTWWYGMPAILKGWLDRVLLPGMAFDLPKGEGDNIKPGLTHITRLGVYTTCGASWWLTRYIGAPGRRTLLRGVRLLCAKDCRTSFAAHYMMDSSTPESRAAHLGKVARALERLLEG